MYGFNNVYLRIVEIILAYSPVLISERVSIDLRIVEIIPAYSPVATNGQTPSIYE